MVFYICVMAIEKVIVLGGDLNVSNPLEKYLRRCRYAVASASNIASARRYLGKDNFNLIFLDPSLSDGSGMDFLKEMQAQPQKSLAVKDLEVANPVGGVCALAEIERRHILNTPQHCKGNRKHAARLLEASIRTLRNRPHEYKDALPSRGEESRLAFA